MRCAANFWLLYEAPAGQVTDSVLHRAPFDSETATGPLARMGDPDPPVGCLRSASGKRSQADGCRVYSRLPKSRRAAPVKWIYWHPGCSLCPQAGPITWPLSWGPGPRPKAVDGAEDQMAQEGRCRSGGPSGDQPPAADAFSLLDVAVD